MPEKKKTNKLGIATKTSGPVRLNWLTATLIWLFTRIWLFTGWSGLSRWIGKSDSSSKLFQGSKPTTQTRKIENTFNMATPAKIWTMGLASFKPTPPINHSPRWTKFRAGLYTVKSCKMFKWNQLTTWYHLVSPSLRNHKLLQVHFCSSIWIILKQKETSTSYIDVRPHMEDQPFANKKK